MTMALEGIKILEITRVGIVSFANMILGDMGADIIKIEEPITSDTPRLGTGWSPVDDGSEEVQTRLSITTPRKGKREAAYHPIHRNKKSIAVNLKSPEGRQIFYKLARQADVIMEGFRPGVMDRLGLGYKQIKEINPKIIYLAISGYGQDGPYRDLPGHDGNYLSIAGALGLIGERGGRPVFPLNLVGDWAGGSLYAAIGVLTALMARERTGKGQYVDISMTDGVLSLMTALARDYFLTGAVPKRGEMSLNGAFPSYCIQETKDGKYLTLACEEPWFWERLCRLLSREDFIPFQHDEGQKREEIFTFFRQAFLGKNRDEWFEIFKKNDICGAPVYELDEVFKDPQVIHRQMLVEVEHPTVGKAKQVGIPIKLSDTPGQIRCSAPVLGQHTDEILSGLGYTGEKIAQLKKAGLVK